MELATARNRPFWMSKVPDCSRVHGFGTGGLAGGAGAGAGAGSCAVVVDEEEVVATGGGGALLLAVLEGGLDSGRDGFAGSFG